MNIKEIHDHIQISIDQDQSYTALMVKTQVLLAQFPENWDYICRFSFLRQEMNVVILLKGYLQIFSFTGNEPWEFFDIHPENAPMKAKYFESHDPAVFAAFVRAFIMGREYAQ